MFMFLYLEHNFFRSSIWLLNPRNAHKINVSRHIRLSSNCHGNTSKGDTTCAYYVASIIDREESASPSLPLPFSPSPPLTQQQSPCVVGGGGERKGLFLPLLSLKFPIHPKFYLLYFFLLFNCWFWFLLLKSDALLLLSTLAFRSGLGLV